MKWLQKVHILDVVLTTVLLVAVIFVATNIAEDTYICNYATTNGVQQFELKSVHFLKFAPKVHTPVFCELKPGTSVWLDPPDFK
jgi:hypothetical protein